MSVLAQQFPTLMDLATVLDPNNEPAKIIELLSSRTPAMKDAVVIPANGDTGHQVNARTALPDLSNNWRVANAGVAGAQGAVDTWEETWGMLEMPSKVDEAIAKRNGGAHYRTVKDAGVVQGMWKEMETGIFYHSTKASPQKFHGLSARYASTTARGGGQVVLADVAAAGADQTSIWLVGWGKDATHGIVPPNEGSGLTHRDLGLDEIIDPADSTKSFLGFTSWYKWNFGLAVEDYRKNARIANIDTSALSTTGDNIVPAMISAYYRIYEPETVKLVWYMNNRVAEYLHHQARNKTSNSTITIEKVGGAPVLSLLGVEIHLTDSITNAESVVA